MPEILPERAVDEAERAVENAQRVRRYHRRRTERKSSQRGADIEVALDRIRDAMRPLRSEIGRFPYGPQTDTAAHNRQRIRDCSSALQSERRKLWKMRARA